MKLLPKESWIIEITDDNLHIAAGIWESPVGYRFWEKILLSDLPNRFIGIEDLKRFGIMARVPASSPKHE